MKEFRPSNQVGAFIKKHLDHVDFKFSNGLEETGQRVGERKAPVTYAKCLHDGVEMKIKLEPGRDTS